MEMPYNHANHTRQHTGTSTSMHDASFLAYHHSAFPSQAFFPETPNGDNIGKEPTLHPESQTFTSASNSLDNVTTVPQTRTVSPSTPVTDRSDFHPHPEECSAPLSPNLAPAFLDDDFMMDWSQQNNVELDLGPHSSLFGLSNEDQPGPAIEATAALPWSISDPASLTPDNPYLQAANQDVTRSPPPSPTVIEIVTFWCTFCRPQMNRCIDFPSEAALKLHIETDHKFQCKSCANVGFKHQYQLTKHYQTQKHRPKTPGRPSDIPCYRCGRCGQFCPHRANHRRHIQTCKGGTLDEPMSYECAYHGATSVDKNDHVAHLEHDCKKKGQKNNNAGRETGSGSGNGSPSSTES